MCIFSNIITFHKNVSFQSKLVLKFFPDFLHLHVFKISSIIYNRIQCCYGILYTYIDLTYLLQLRCCFSLRLLPVIFVIFFIMEIYYGFGHLQIVYFFYFQSFRQAILFCFYLFIITPTLYFHLCAFSVNTFAPAYIKWFISLVHSFFMTIAILY